MKYFCVGAALLATLLCGMPSSLVAQSESPDHETVKKELKKRIADKKARGEIPSSEPVSIAGFYRALGKSAGKKILIDPLFNNLEVSLNLEGKSFEEALKYTTQTYRHMYTYLDDDTIVIADDTPQNRRHYEKQVIQTFSFKHIEGKTLMTLLRSTLGVKHIALDQDVRFLTVRDTAERVAIAERLIQAYDRHPGEVQLNFEVLSVDAAVLRGLQQRHPAGAASDIASAPAMLKELRQHPATRQLAQPSLRMLGYSQSGLRLADHVKAPDIEDRLIESGLNIQAMSQIDPDLDAVRVQLKVEMTTFLANECTPNGQFGERQLETSVDLKDGRAFLLSGFAQTVDSGDGQQMHGVFGCSGEEHGSREILVAVTPEILKRPEAPSDEFALLRIGTEAHLALEN